MLGLRTVHQGLPFQGDGNEALGPNVVAIFASMGISRSRTIHLGDLIVAVFSCSTHLLPQISAVVSRVVPSEKFALRGCLIYHTKLIHGSLVRQAVKVV